VRRAKGRTKGPKATWVYRGFAGQFLPAQTVTLDNETYAATIFTLPSSSGFQAFSLYDSHQYAEIALVGNTGVGQGFAGLNASARPGGSRARCLAVAGEVRYEPSAWAIGNQIHLGFRIGILEQDQADGAYIGVPGYSMWNGAAWSDQAAQSAQGMQNLWEDRRFHAFNAETTSPIFSKQVFVRLNGGKGVTLSPKYGLSFGMETDAASVGTRVQLWLRTLVVDEG